MAVMNLVEVWRLAGAGVSVSTGGVVSGSGVGVGSAAEDAELLELLELSEEDEDEDDSLETELADSEAYSNKQMSAMTPVIPRAYSPSLRRPTPRRIP